MKRFYVRLAGDNDFCNTVKAFMEAVAPRVFSEWKGITKEAIVNLFNEHAYSLYCLHQSQDGQVAPHMKNYLIIEVKDVYFDEEIDKFNNHNGDGCLAALMYDNSIQYFIM